MPGVEIYKETVIPEAKAGLWSTWTYSWMNPLFRLGKLRPLELNDVWMLSENERTLHCSRELSDMWGEELQNSRKPLLSNPIFKYSLKTLLLSGILRFISEFGALLTPFLVKALVEFVAEYKAGKPVQLGDAIGYAVGMLLISLNSTFLTNRYVLMCLHVAIRVRMALISMIYEKSTKLTAAARSSFNAGKVMTLISTDVSRIEGFLQTINVMWICPVQILSIIGFLIYVIGPSALVGLAVLIVTSPLQKTLMGKLRELRKSVAPITDERVKIVQEAMQGIRVIKFFNWDTTFRDHVEEKREKELYLVFKRNIISAIAITVGFALPTIASALTFIVYGLTNPTLDPARIFAALSWFALLKNPLMQLPSILVSLAEYRVAIQRIQDMLQAPEVQDKPVFNKNQPEGVLIQDGKFIWETTAVETKAKKQKTDENTIEENKSHLTNINISIPKGKLVAIVGAVGSGKSTLLNSLIGETKKLSGKVSFSGKVGYAAQQAWIQNATVKDNILFGLPYERTRYLRAIRACCLEKDLEVLADGDMTQIGERGINLSGGQKQRVNLARMVYFNPDIVLMDDPLSAVDAHVGRYLFDECIKGSLKEKTRVLVTHQLHFLPEVDYIYVLKAGQVAEQGSYAELIHANGEFAQLMRDYGNTEEQDDEKEKVEPVPSGPEEEVLSRIEKLLEMKQESENKELMTKEDRETGSVPAYVWFMYAKASGGVPFLIGLFMLLVLMQVSRVGTDFWLTIWTNNSVPSFSQGAYVGVYSAWSVLQALFLYIFGVYFAYASTRASTIMHKSALHNILRAPVRFFDTTPIGRIMNRFSKDQDSVDNTIMPVIRIMCMNMSNAISVFAVVVYATPWFAAPFCVILVGYLYVQNIYRQTSRELKRVDSLARSPVYSFLGESLNGIATIRAYGEEDRFINKNANNVDVQNGPYLILNVAARWLSVRLESMGAFLVFFAALFGVLARDQPYFSPALFGISLSYALQVTSTLNMCIRQFTDTEIAMNAVERIAHYGTKVEQEPPAIVESNRTPKGWPVKGTIDFRNVNFQYAPDLPLVLKNISFSVKDGEKIGIVGRTGSGKSSIMQALFRMYEVQSGEIEIDGLVVQKIGVQDLRSGLAIIPQDPVLFSGSYRRNLDPFNNYTDEQVWDALDRANVKLKVQESGGLDGFVSEGGENLSVGQRQLVCLARAMLRKPKILIMDEATANVDFETDAIIQKCLREDMGQATILTIAHRLNTVMDYDRILVLDQGTVVEFDTPSALMQIENGVFRAMAQTSQT
ncbi:P-loop containing nucleoside triphosphate hydrolase protein [Gorgonomyces haynaldii]|nr:P-loop containing nucleoside triphosphate hydrolase protein [Gorgonomyces haynaldii]